MLTDYFDELSLRRHKTPIAQLDLPEARCLKVAYSQLHDPRDVQPLSKPPVTSFHKLTTSSLLTTTDALALQLHQRSSMNLPILELSSRLSVPKENLTSD
jgi:hypothetical protein